MKVKLPKLSDYIGEIKSRHKLSSLQSLKERLDRERLKFERKYPGEKYVIICNDYAGLELRIMTLYSRDLNMTRLLSDRKEDVHQNTANKAGVDRNPTAKEINFLVQFGGGAFALAEKLTSVGVPTTTSQAAAYITAWDLEYPRVPLHRSRLLAEHKKLGYITYFTGRRRWIPDVDWESKSSRHKAETTLANNSVQGVGQDFLKAATLRTDVNAANVDFRVLYHSNDIPFMTADHRKLLQEYAVKTEKRRRLFRGARLQYVLQVHDEILHFCKESAAAEVAPLVSEMMCWKHPFPRHPDYRYCVPLVTEGGVDYDWKSAKGKTPMIKLEAGWESFELERPD